MVMLYQAWRLGFVWYASWGNVCTEFVDQATIVEAWSTVCCACLQCEMLFNKCEDQVREEVLDVHGEGDLQPSPASAH
jgi:hypothetical protein